MLKKLISSILVIAMMGNIGISTFASENENVDVGDLQDYLNSEVGEAMSNTNWAFLILQPTNIYTKSESIINIDIPYVGFSSFLDLSNFGEEVDISQIKIENSNEDVVSTFFPDQLSAIGVGKAVLTYTYGDLKQVIEVSVEKQLDEDLIQQLQRKSLSGVNPRTTTRNSILQKNDAMLNYEWAPKKQLIKWGKSQNYFPAGIYQRGLPYTQATQCDEITFPLKMSASDFYTESGTTINKTYYYQPKYGSDCSGYVSYCWGISRIDTASFYDRAVNGTYKLLTDFNQLQPGDAVVRAKDHIMLIGLNYETPPVGSSYTESYVFVYEQTPPKARYQFYTYAQLKARPYTPISYFK